jgi:hypothetical protein
MACAILLRRSRNTSRDVYRARVRHVVCVILVTRQVMFTARASAILFVASHSTVAWLPSNSCKQYHIAYSMHVTIHLLK